MRFAAYHIVTVMGLILAAISPAAQGQPAGVTDLDQRLIAAAEYFEAITEQAYTKSPAELTALLSRGEQAISELAPRLPIDAQNALTAALAELKTSLARGAPSRTAIGAVEAYRALVNELSSAHVVPKQVSLLDYAGFKYDALLKSEPTDWAEIAKTLSFADQQWNAISGRVSDLPLRGAFAESLSAMRVAAAANDKGRAGTVVQRELALVDDLEKYFMTTR